MNRMAGRRLAGRLARRSAPFRAIESNCCPISGTAWLHRSCRADRQSGIPRLVAGANTSVECRYLTGPQAPAAAVRPRRLPIAASGRTSQDAVIWWCLPLAAELQATGSRTDVTRLISITLLPLLLGLPVASPLLARTCCCCDRSNCGSLTMLRSTGSCCNMSATPETTSPAKLDIVPELALPSPAGPVVESDAVLLDSPVFGAFPTSHALFLQVPLRI